MNPYIFNFFNGVIITLLSIWAYSQNWNHALYFILLGILLIGLTYAVRNSNKVLGSVAMLSTIVSTVVLAVILYFLKTDAAVSSTPVAMMMTSSFVTSLAFIQCAVNHSEEEDCCVQPSDGTACSDKNLSERENSRPTGCC